MYAVLQLEAEEKELQQSEAQVGLHGGLGPTGLVWKQAAQCLPVLPCQSVVSTPGMSSEPQTFVGSAFLQLSGYILSDGADLLLSPQINTAKRLLEREKGKEASNHEPERSWFQTKEERKKEKSMLERSLKKLNTQFS